MGLLDRLKLNKTKDFFEWLDLILKNELNSEIKAINFNLYEDTDNKWSVELVGTFSFDKDNDDWACDVDYEPVDKYLNIEGVDVDPDKFLNEVITILLDIISLEKVSAWLLHTKYITVGFDDGVLEKIR